MNNLPVPPPIPPEWTSPPPPPIKKTRPPLLAWWAVVPVGAFVVLEITFGWPLAKLEATAPAYAISNLMGRIMGGMLFSWLIAWVAYRLASRSQMAGSIVFSCVLLLAGASEFAKYRRFEHQAEIPAAGESPVVKEAPTRRFSHFAVAIAEPHEWAEMIPNDLNEFGHWISKDSDPEKPRGLILLRGEKPKSGVAEDLARQLARDWGGAITNDRDEVAGERAWRIEGQPGALEARPVEALVTMHNGHVYVLMGAVMRGNTCHEQIETIRRSWKWIDLQAPSEHMEFHQRPIAFLDGAATINFPAVMTSFKPQGLNRAQGLSLYNLQRGEMDFDVIFQLLDVPDEALDQAREGLSKGLEGKLKLSEKFVWHPVKGQARGWITQVVAMPSPERSAWGMWAIVGLGTKQALLINFTFETPDAKDRAVYANSGEKIIESISRQK